MMLFAHTGIWLGLVWLPNLAFANRRGTPADASSAGSIPGGTPAQSNGRTARGVSSPDYRLVLVGFMLPDIIDKPLGGWLLRDALSSGRIYAHTLAFSTMLLALGVFLYVSRRQWAGFRLAFGSIVHLCLDQMWLSPGTLLWPLYGWRFPAVDTNGWVERVFANLFKDPAVYVPEIIGATVLAAFCVCVLRKQGIVSFLRSGAAV